MCIVVLKLKINSYIYISMSIIVNRFELYLSPIHTKNNNYDSNYKDTDISVHTSGRYRLFILSARSSAALNSPACFGRFDSYWRSIFLSFISWKK